MISDDTKIAVMAQMGTFTSDDFVPRKDSLVSMVRILIAYHCVNKDDSVLNIELIKETCEMVTKLKELGYEVTVNVGRIDKMSDKQIEQTCKLISECKPVYFYIADTYGNLGITKMNYILDVIKKNYTGKNRFSMHTTIY